MEEKKSFRPERWWSLPVIAVAVAAYANSFFMPFIFDDQAVIVRYPRISHIAAIAWDSRFITNFTFRLNCVMGGMNVVHYHMTNLLVHIAAGLVLYGVVRRTLLISRLRYRYGAISAPFAAFCASLWVAHPLQTESVTYICQRYESLMGLFFLLAVYCFVRGLSSFRQRLWFDACIGACMVGMATKETMVAAPLFILIFDYVMSSESLVGLMRQRWKFYVALACTLGMLAMFELKMTASIIKAGAHTHVQTTASGAGLSAGPHLPYFVTQFQVIAHYVRLVFFPHPLCLDYGWEPVERISTVVLPGIFILGLIVLTVVGIWKKSPIGLLGAWFFGTLAPSSSIIPLSDLAFEHRMYLPSAAVIIAAAVAAMHGLDALGSQLGMNTKTASTVRGLLGILCVSCCVLLTSMRNMDYASEEIMWRDVVSKRPRNLRARNNLAVVLCETENPDKITEAMVHYRYVLEQTEGKVAPVTSPRAMADNSLENNRFKALVNLGVLASSRHRYDEAANRYIEATKIYPYTDYLPKYLRRSLIRSGVPGEKVEEEIVRRLSGK